MQKILLFTFLVLIVTACGDDIPLASEVVNHQAPVVKTSGPFQLELNIKSSQNKKIQDVEAAFTLTNRTDTTIEYVFPSGCQSGFKVERDQKVLLDSRQLFFCTGALSSLKLEPGEKETYPIFFSDIKESIQLQKGSYQLSVFLLEGFSDEISISFELK